MNGTSSPKLKLAVALRILPLERGYNVITLNVLEFVIQQQVDSSGGYREGRDHPHREFAGNPDSQAAFKKISPKKCRNRGNG